MLYPPEWNRIGYNLIQGSPGFQVNRLEFRVFRQGGNGSGSGVGVESYFFFKKKKNYYNDWMSECYAWRGGPDMYPKREWMTNQGVGMLLPFQYNYSVRSCFCPLCLALKWRISMWPWATRYYMLWINEFGEKGRYFFC